MYLLDDLVLSRLGFCDDFPDRAAHVELVFLESGRLCRELGDGLLERVDTLRDCFEEVRELLASLEDHRQLQPRELAVSRRLPSFSSRSARG